MIFRYLLILCFLSIFLDYSSARKFDLNSPDSKMIIDGRGIDPEKILSYDGLMQCMKFEDKIFDEKNNLNLANIDQINIKNSIEIHEKTIQNLIKNEFKDQYKSIILNSEINSLKYEKNKLQISSMNIGILRRQIEFYSRQFDEKCKDMFFLQRDFVKIRKISG